MHTIYLSGGGEKQHFGGFKNKQEVKSFLLQTFPNKVAFPTHGKVDIFIIPNNVKQPSDSAIKKYGTNEMRVFHLKDFLTWKKRRTFATIDSKKLNKSSESKGKSKKGKESKTASKTASQTKESKTKESKTKSKAESKTESKTKSKTKSKAESKKSSNTKSKKPSKQTIDELESKMWKVITKLDWQKDHDAQRIKNNLNKFPMELYLLLDMFVHEKTELLMQRFKLEDVPWEVYSEVVTMGPIVYNSMTRYELKKLAKKSYPVHFELLFDR